MSAGPTGWDDSMAMSLLAKLKSDLKQALLQKNEAVKGAIRIIISEFPTKITVPITLESGKKSSRPKREEEITSDEVIAVIMGLVKSEKQTLEYKKESTSDYLQILESYLPRMASDEEITAWITANIDFSQFKAPMQAMGAIMKHFGKKADGKVVKKILQQMSQG